MRYTASTRRRRPGEPNGCAALLLIVMVLAVIGLAVQYWYITVPVLGAFAVLVLLARLAKRDP